MDFEQLLFGYRNKTCILSVDSYGENRFGNIRIVAGNQAHCDDMKMTMHKEFVPDSPYEEYFPKDRNFEDFCYRSAILGQSLHTYVPLPQMGLWLNMFLLPLTSDKENTGYCIYSYDVAPAEDSEKRASLAADTSSAVLQTCIKLRGSSNTRNSLNEVVEDIREICESDHCCLMLMDEDTKECSVLAESITEGSGIMPMTTYLDDQFYEIAKTWKDTLGDSTCVILEDEHEMDWLKSVNPVWYDSLKSANVGNIVLFPLNYNDETLGYIWATHFNTENTVKIKETLELTTFFIASEIANYQLLQKLERMGTMDMLTGVRNRNAMNNKVCDVVSGDDPVACPYAVVFADLNGLKRTNDEEGHDEGDKLLIAAAEALRIAFPDAEVYRAGGDEFVIISPSTDADALAAKLSEMEKQAQQKKVEFAVGTNIVHEGEDIRTAMHLADEMMYAVKNEYYEEHPEKKYR